MSEENFFQRIAPQTHERASTCDVHGAYTERGGQLMAGARIMWFGCPTCSKAAREREEAEAERQAEAQRQARIEARLNMAGIPLAFRDRNFDNYLVDGAEQQHALDVARDFADNFWTRHRPAGGCLVFAGEMGTGKSHLAIAIAQQVMHRGTAMYIRTADLIRRFRATWVQGAKQSEEDVLHIFASLGLLVIDEVGMQRGSEDEQRILFDVFDRRYAELRPTILLTNLNGPAFAEVIGPRIMDRLKERAVFVPFKWTSYRGRAAAK